MEVIIGIKPVLGDHESNFKKYHGNPFLVYALKCSVKVQPLKRTVNNITQTMAILPFLNEREDVYIF